MSYSKLRRDQYLTEIAKNRPEISSIEQGSTKTQNPLRSRPLVDPWSQQRNWSLHHTKRLISIFRVYLIQKSNQCESLSVTGTGLIGPRSICPNRKWDVRWSQIRKGIHKDSELWHLSINEAEQTANKEAPHKVWLRCSRTTSVGSWIPVFYSDQRTIHQFNIF